MSRVLLLLILLAGCAGRPPPAERFHTLEPALPAAQTDYELRLSVQPVEAYGVYAERALLVRTADGALRQQPYELWSEPPALLIGEALQRLLRAALGDAQVHARATRSRPDLILRTRLRRLELVLAPDGPQAQLGLSVTLSEYDNEPLWVLEIDEQQRLSSTDAVAVATAQAQLLERAAAAVIARLPDRLGATASSPEAAP
ncbi:MAG TPA: ABC-type transport auxiliary lipoprotein family protein [Nevskiaceae bacterium]|nr:ABC-type transport auxiliary lipoprotein family protein [Nevskiaceae bacterium]